jgi:hypothetical protein
MDSRRKEITCSEANQCPKCFHPTLMPILQNHMENTIFALLPRQKEVSFEQEIPNCKNIGQNGKYARGEMLEYSEYINMSKNE